MSSVRSVELTAEQRRAESRAMWRWTSLIVGLLSMNAAMCIGAAVLATRSGATNIVPEYYQQAPDPDQHRTSPGIHK